MEQKHFSRAALWLPALALVLSCGIALPVEAQEAGLERSEPDGCADCHFNPGMAETVSDWETSEHGQSFDWGAGANTYCAECKSPLLWNPAATSDTNDPIPVEEWQDVTCSSCHPPHDERVEWGTPIGVIADPTADDPHDKWMPLYDIDELCVSCHSGTRHAKSFQGFGKVMFYKKDVGCADCHMAEVPNSSPDGFGASHTWSVYGSLPYSCGIGAGNCHFNKTMKWAEKQIEKMKVHGKDK